MYLLVRKNWLRATSLLVLIYTVGMLGLLSPYQTQFLGLTPMTLLLTACLLFSYHQPWSRDFVIFCGITWIISFLVEVMAVKSGLVFGPYHYGTTLGWRLWGVPVLIGINWLVLVYAVGNMLHPLHVSVALRSMAGAGLMVLMDRFMEPVAVRLGFWQWDSEDIPLQNYVIWYVLSWLLLVLFYNVDTQPYNKMGWIVYTVLLIFFGLLNWLLI